MIDKDLSLKLDYFFIWNLLTGLGPGVPTGPSACFGGPRGPVVLKLSRCQMGFLRHVRFLETELPITKIYMETSWAIKVTKSSKPQSNWA